MYRCEIWILKKAEHWRIDAFKLWCWRRLLRVSGCKEIKPVNPKGNRPWIFIGNTDAQAEAPILWPPDAKSQLIGKTKTKPWQWERLKAGGEGDDRDGWMASSTQWTWVWTSSERWWRTWEPGMLQSMGSQRVDTMELLNNNRLSYPDHCRNACRILVPFSKKRSIFNEQDPS